MRAPQGSFVRCVAKICTIVLTRVHGRWPTPVPLITLLLQLLSVWCQGSGKQRPSGVITFCWAAGMPRNILRPLKGLLQV